MWRIGVAFWAFWVALFNRTKAEQIRGVLKGQGLPKVIIDEKTQPSGAGLNKTIVAEAAPKRSEAITLIAALQREARLVDLVQEPLDSYTDEQIGGAARNVLKDSAAVLDRFFALRPMLSQEEGANLEVPLGYDPAKYRLTGKVEGSGPFHGRLTHKGWIATTCALPTWTGSKDAALVIAPAEVEV